MSDETYHDVNGVQLHIADYVRRIPQGVPGRVLAFDDVTGSVLVEWPQIEEAMPEDERNLERIAPPTTDVLPVLEVWKSDEYAPSPNVTWEVLGKYQNIDLEMWTCRIITPEKPQGYLADCYGAYVELDSMMIKQQPVAKSEGYYEQ